MLNQRDIETLATYNSEVNRGVVHTDEYDRRMSIMQRRFNGVAVTPAPSYDGFLGLCRFLVEKGNW